jgi:Tfp pilus assembly protein PilO
MRASTKRFLSLLIALSMAGVTVIVYANLLSPAFGEVAELRGRIAANEGLLANQANAVQKFKELLGLYSDQYKALDKTLSGALPSKEEVPTVVNQIQSLSKVSNLALQSVTFKYAALKPAPRAGFTLVKPLGTLSVTMQAAGSYEGMKAFLRALETNIRVMDIVSLKIDPVRRGDATVPNLFLYTIEVSTYYQ